MKLVDPPLVSVRPVAIIPAFLASQDLQVFHQHDSGHVQCAVVLYSVNVCLLVGVPNRH